MSKEFEEVETGCVIELTHKTYLMQVKTLLTICGKNIETTHLGTFKRVSQHWLVNMT